MNGQTDLVLDTDASLACLRGDETVSRIVRASSDVRSHVSVITRMELLAFRGLTQEMEAAIRRFLDDIQVVPLDAGVERVAIALRRETGRKLPDAIVAATAVWLRATLVTCDRKLANTQFNGLRTFHVPGGPDTPPEPPG